MHTGSILEHFASALVEFVQVRTTDGRHSDLPDLSVAPGLRLIRLFEHATKVTGDDFLGLASQPCPPGSYRFMSEVAVRCSALEECLRLSFRFVGLVCPAAHYSIETTDKEVAIVIEIDGLDGRIGAILRQWQLVTVHRLAQWLIGAEIPMSSVELQDPMEFAFGEYAEIFGGNCSFNRPSTRLTFPRSYLDRRIVRTPEDLERQYSAPRGNITNPESVSRTWKQLVKRALRINILAESPLSTIDSLAAEFGFSSQTLRRRLRDENTSYRQLKAEVRRETALDALSDAKTSLAEASLRAGFAESNGLTRALRASTGEGSKQLRSQLQAWQQSKMRH